MNHQFIHTDHAPSPIGPYSQATRAGDTIYVSGQIAINAETNELETDTLEQETERVLENLKQVLLAAGAKLENVVKCSIFISDMNNFGRINEVYGKYFQRNQPARETVEVAGLPKGVNVEISCIAVV
ncbi:RidA family protein [Salibacter halophilus]|uniref:RidA family protein n=1 Tax=Salibacter halophilus TaxID=1803916 RepID=A0A6N6M5H4_9FLAO|nr:RidA family protein [Salibacter halophilus]KAB1064773.1 RidA family protein [Salibacter halophilus]